MISPACTSLKVGLERFQSSRNILVHGRGTMEKGGKSLCRWKQKRRRRRRRRRRKRKGEEEAEKARNRASRLHRDRM